MTGILQLSNPFGFDAADLMELLVAASLVALILLRGWAEPVALRLASRTGLSIAMLAVLPGALRLGLLRNHPIPTPAVSDDFSYVLLADTFLRGRLANPTHPLHQFFETYFVLQEPAYSSIFPPGQGIALALGWLIFGHPWAGVAISSGVFCALCYWMLRGWTSPGWALLGGLFAVMQFGPMSQWMNSYWGGAVSAMAGCLVFGALPRLVDAPRLRYAALIGIGLGLQILTRPFESALLTLGMLLFPIRWIAWRPLLVMSLAIAPAAVLTLLHNRAVTLNWTTLPYMESRYQYGVPGTFTFQPNPVSHRMLTPQQQLAYDASVEIHGPATDTWASYWWRLAGRVRYYRFFFLPALYLVVPWFVPAVRTWRFAWVVLCVLVFALGTNFYPYFYPHYIAAMACLFVLIQVTGLAWLERLAGAFAVRLIVFLCVAHFLFWYGVHAFGSAPLLAAVAPYETWDAINRGDPEGRIAIRRQLEETPGRHLVFVHYSARHGFEEWVHNGADIDASRIVWARDLGEAENEKLRAYYAGRSAWMLEPDVKPPRLTEIGN